MRVPKSKNYRCDEKSCLTRKSMGHEKSGEGRWPVPGREGRKKCDKNQGLGLTERGSTQPVQAYLLKWPNRTRRRQRSLDTKSRESTEKMAGKKAMK